MREVKAKVGKIGAGLKMNGMGWLVTACLFADERKLQRVVDQFHSVCNTRKMRVNAGKSKVMVFERREVEVVHFGSPYRVGVPVDERCEIVMGRGQDGGSKGV